MSNQWLNFRIFKNPHSSFNIHHFSFIHTSPLTLSRSLLEFCPVLGWMVSQSCETGQGQKPNGEPRQEALCAAPSSAPTSLRRLSRPKRSRKPRSSTPAPSQIELARCGERGERFALSSLPNSFPPSPAHGGFLLPLAQFWETGSFPPFEPVVEMWASRHYISLSVRFSILRKSLMFRVTRDEPVKSTVTALPATTNFFKGFERVRFLFFPHACDFLPHQHTLTWRK